MERLSCIVHYGEIGLKGLNRPFFVKKLISNIKERVNEKIEHLSSRIVFQVDSRDLESVKENLEKVFGIEWFCFSYKSSLNINQIKELIEKKFDIKRDQTFKIETKRADKSFYLNSSEINKILGEHVIKKFKCKVSLKSPQKIIYIEIFDKNAYIYFQKFKGLGGLPIGCSGKILNLLSGGIDSPVAAFLLMKRGCMVDNLHFHGFKKFEERDVEKIIKIGKILSEYYKKMKIYFVPFYPFEAEALKINEKYRLVLFRRFMFRFAEIVATNKKYDSLSSGENLAQVASQTIENINIIQRDLKIPVLRPLISNDKKETIELAKRIGTYYISIQKYRDCCSLLIPKHPILRPKLDKIEKLEKKLNIEKIIDECSKEMVEIKFNKL